MMPVFPVNGVIIILLADASVTSDSGDSYWNH